MQSIRIRSRIGKNGILQIQLPQTTEGTELDIILIYEPASPPKAVAKPRDFYGCIQDDAFLDIHNLIFSYPQHERICPHSPPPTGRLGKIK